MKTANTQHMTQHPAYKAAREQADRLAAEHAKIQSEIEAIHAQRNKTKDGDLWLAAGVAALEGDSADAPKLADLTRRANAIYYSIGPAHMAIHGAVRLASSEYWKTQAPATLKAMDSLVASLESVLVACNEFETIRDQGESLGYDSDSGGLPIGADQRYRVWAEEMLPELRKDADRLRDSLDPGLDDAVMTIQALSNLNIYGISLKGGEIGDIKARYARELIRCGSAEESSPGRSRMTKLKNLIGD